MRPNVWFHDFHIFSARASFTIAGKNLTSLRLFVHKNFLRSRRASHASSQDKKTLETFNMCIQFGIKHLKHGKNSWFFDFHIFAVRASLMICVKFSRSLRLFVEKKYLRSRRAGLAWTKTTKVQKRSICTWKCHNNLECKQTFMISWCFT